MNFEAARAPHKVASVLLAARVRVAVPRGSKWGHNILKATELARSAALIFRNRSGVGTVAGVGVVKRVDETRQA